MPALPKRLPQRTLTSPVKFDQEGLRPMIYRPKYPVEGNMQVDGTGDYGNRS